MNLESLNLWLIKSWYGGRAFAIDNDSNLWTFDGIRKGFVRVASPKVAWVTINKQGDLYAVNNTQSSFQILQSKITALLRLEPYLKTLDPAHQMCTS